MVKLFVVEDEIIMRNGLKSIQWEKEDIMLVGDASDGELAYPMILESKPDILVTDIKMPFMDGLELSERVKKELPDIQIVILSGFDEFSYAQKAVSIGVSEYLLKPVVPNKLLEVVCRLKQKIEENNRQNEDWDALEGIYEEKKELKKQRFFMDLVMNNKSSSEILDIAKELDINISTRFFAIILIHVKAKDGQDCDFARIRERVKTNIDSVLLEHTGWTLFDRGENGFALLVTRNHMDSIEHTITETLGQMEIKLNKDDECCYFISVGDVVNRMSEIKLSYDSATKGASFRYFIKVNQTVYSDNLPNNSFEEPDGEMDLNHAATNAEIREALDRFLRTGTKEEISPIIDSLFHAAGEKNLNSKIYLTYFMMDIYLTFIRFAKESEIDTEEINDRYKDVYEILKNDVTCEEAKIYITDYLNALIDKRDQKKDRKYNKALQEAVEYIDANFCNDSLSLSEAAAVANLSPNHFSAMFSQEMGSTFVEYLINKRMDKAKELLMTTDLRSSEIAYKVGYKDPHYFSHTFKKNMGMSPSEYRGRSN